MIPKNKILENFLIFNIKKYNLFWGSVKPCLIFGMASPGLYFIMNNFILLWMTMEIYPYVSVSKYLLPPPLDTKKSHGRI